MNVTSRFKLPPLPRYTCADCGRSCTLPFIPRPNTPVTCTDCFKLQRQPLGRREPVTHLPLTPPEDRMFKAGLSWRWKPKA